MRNYNRNAVLSRIEAMAKKVYRRNPNAVCMLINDLEDFFEMNDYDKDMDRMTSQEFDSYIDKIRD